MNNIDFFHNANWERLNLDEHTNYTQTKEDATIIIDEIDCITDLIEHNKELATINKSVYYFICFRLNLDNNKTLLDLPIFSNPQIFFLHLI